MYHELFCLIGHAVIIIAVVIIAVFRATIHNEARVASTLPAGSIRVTVDIICSEQAVLFSPRKSIFPQSLKTGVDTRKMTENWILQCNCTSYVHFPSGIEQDCWRRSQIASVSKLADLGLAVIVLHYPRVLANRLADDHVAEMNVSLFSSGRYAAAYANQHTESEPREGVPHLRCDYGRRAVSRGVEASNHDVVSVDASKRVNIMVTGRLWQTFMFTVQHDYCSGLLDRQRADPSHSIVIMSQSGFI